MIPLYKLEQLPRSQRLRKAASVVGGAEHRLVVFGELPAREIEYLGSLAEFLARDESFSKTAAAALEAARSNISVYAIKEAIRRSLNTVHHILLSETGRYTADWDFYQSPGLLDSSKRQPFPGMWIYLEDIRSPFNVGSMFRAAESFGAEKMWLSPLCADPRHKRAERTAMGCVDILPWERLSGDPFAELREGEPAGAGFFPFSEGPFFALETGGIPLKDFSFPPRGILIVGSEELGVSPQALTAANTSLGKVSIPTYGAKGSLNVSVAFVIVMQEWSAALN